MQEMERSFNSIATTRLMAKATAKPSFGEVCCGTQYSYSCSNNGWCTIAASLHLSVKYLGRLGR